MNTEGKHIISTMVIISNIKIGYAYLPDWRLHTSHNNNTLQGVNNSAACTWHNYIDLISYGVLIKLKLFDSLMKVKYDIQKQAIDRTCLRSVLYNDNIVTAPCFSFHYITWTPSYEEWLIFVHSDFIVNITIIMSYVPVSVRCASHNIRLHDCHDIHHAFDPAQHCLLENLCGTIAMKLYTQQMRVCWYS